MSLMHSLKGVAEIGLAAELPASFRYSCAKTRSIATRETNSKRLRPLRDLRSCRAPNIRIAMFLVHSLKGVAEIRLAAELPASFRCPYGCSIISSSIEKV